MSAPIAVSGSITSCGGTVLASQFSVLSKSGLPIVRLGDVHVCPFPPFGGIVSANLSIKVLIGSLPAAKVGSITSCGSTILTGDFQTLVT